MPTYDYHCEGCGETIEIFHSIKDPPVKLCPKCGEEKLQRKLGTGGGLIFKGSGFYTTDYRSEGYKKAAGSDSSSGGESKTAAESKSSSDSKSSDTTSSPSSTPSSTSTPSSSGSSGSGDKPATK